MNHGRTFVTNVIWSAIVMAIADASLLGDLSQARPVHPFKSPSFFNPSLPSAAAISGITQLRGGESEGNDESDNNVAASRPYLPHTLTVRDSIMIAHSFHNHPSFGPAGGLHGATYTADVEFASASLHPECNWVIDIGVASEFLSEVLEKYNFKNLDEVFGDGVMTTTEFMCKVVFEGLVKKLKVKYGKDGEDGFRGWIKVTLWESHKAWGSFEGPCL